MPRCGVSVGAAGVLRELVFTGLVGCVYALFDVLLEVLLDLHFSE